jgi:hypothetical protein
MAGIYNITIEQGATFTFSAQWKDSEGNVIDLQGYTAKMQIRKNSNHGEVLITLSTDALIDGSGIDIDLNNNIIVTISDAKTATFISDKYFYDLLLIKTSPHEVIRFIEGEVTVSEGVTTLG